ncbi:MAG: cysteine desulfurase [Anaerolineales bacterium]|jgi:cysteine desulfurase/selenocysteine lyase
MNPRPVAPALLDWQGIREQFPILDLEVHPGVRLVYLDSASTSQKPAAVIEAMDRFYRKTNANIHRGVHYLAEEATAEYEQARKRVAEFIGAEQPQEIIFTRNTTESINLVMQTWARVNLHPGDTILLTEMEHHSNIVPWQMLASERGLKLEFVPVTEQGQLDSPSLEHLLEEKRPGLVAVTQMSNVLGTINPVEEIARKAHQAGALVLVDGAQSVPHMAVNVRSLDADFLAFSGHKMCGPTGIGVLYAKRALLEAMPPFMGGGDMIRRVRLRGFEPNEVPYKFEAGTPAIAEAIGLKVAIDFLERVGMDAIHSHEQEIAAYALDRLSEIPGLRVYGPPAEARGGVTSFSMKSAHPHDVAQVLDRYGLAVRAGHHCAMPLHERYGLAATTRASFYLYNTLEEVDRLIEGLGKVNELFA